VILYSLIKNDRVLKFTSKATIIITVTLYILVAITIFNFFFSSFTFSCLIGMFLWIIYPYDEKLIGLLPFRIFALIGFFSYSLYLLHPPLWPFLDMFVRNLFPLNPKITSVLILIPSIYICSFIWCLFFEKPSSLFDVYNRLKTPLKTLFSYKYIFSRASLEH
jgi:peptidoglycan/LPS O-acetylase OafA/YrhL